MLDSIKDFASDSRTQFFAMGFLAGAAVLSVVALACSPKEAVEAAVETATDAVDDVAKATDTAATDADQTKGDTAAEA